jgi:transposase
MQEDIHIQTERIDDFVVLLALIQQMDLPAILDRHLPRHWLQQGLSWGWTASIWLAHIISQGDHRKLTVRDWVRQAHSTLEQVTGLDIRETDFTDDRLTIVLRHLSDLARWHAIEQELGQHLVRVYDLQEQPIRVDATTVSGYHDGGEDSLIGANFNKEKGHSSPPRPREQAASDSTGSTSGCVCADCLAQNGASEADKLASERR